VVSPFLAAAISARSEPAPLLNQHLERLAIVYVRQASTNQVEENIESTELQTAHSFNS
jgi:hypothetical protein